MNTLRLILLLLCAFPLLGAEATTFPLNCRTSTGLFLNATGEINVSKVVRKDADTATIQVEATGSPTSCTVKVSGRLEGMTNAVQIGSSMLRPTSRPRRHPLECRTS